MGKSLHPILVAAIVGLAWVAAPIAAQENPFDTTVDVRMGRRVFESECSRCHGMDAKGTDETGAPDLTTGIFAAASTDQKLFEVVRDGVSGTTMIGIGWAPESTVWQVVAYVNSLSLDPANIDLPGNAALGQQLFDGKGNCSSCHMLDGRGGRTGPDLSAVGNRRSPDELKEDLTAPSADVLPRWWTMKIEQQDGSTVEGLRMNEDTFTLRIMDADENLRHFSKSELRSHERIETSTMPSASEALTASEVDDMVAYMFSLRREER